jgi:hypothetical protein
MKLYQYFETWGVKEFKGYYYILGNEDDYKKIKDYYNLLSVDEIKEIKGDINIANYRYVLTKLGIVDIYSIVNVDYLLDPKDVDPPYLILLKEKDITSHKKYKSVNDLVKDQDVALYFVDSFYKNVYCYNINTLETLFFSNLERQQDNPYGSFAISRAVSANEVAGKNILYPIMAYFSGGIITSSRESVKEVARYVWKDFYDDSSDLIKRYFPIDDKNFLITPSIEDDGKGFRNSYHQYSYDGILKVLKEEINKMDSNTKPLFFELLLINNENDLNIFFNYYTKNAIVNKLRKFFDQQRDISFENQNYCHNNHYIYYILSFITKVLYNQNEAIEVLEKIQKSFLNWTYELKDNSIKDKVKILMKRHDQIFGNDSRAKREIINNAENLWRERY